MEHTPGPWETKRLHCVTAIETESASRITCLFDHQDYAGEPCGSIESQDKTQAEIDANARLIATAPELLEALKQLADYGDKTVQEICDQDTGWYYQLKSALNKAEQAIAKATI